MDLKELGFVYFDNFTSGILALVTDLSQSKTREKRLCSPGSCEDKEGGGGGRGDASIVTVLNIQQSNRVLIYQYQH